MALANQFGLTLSTNGFDDTANTVGSTGRMTWDNANAWIAGMNSANHHGFNDWRLPSMIDNGNDGCNFANTGTDCGYDVLRAPGSFPATTPTTNQSEIASLFHDTLGNLSFRDTAGNVQTGFGLQNVTSGGNTFTNFQTIYYWSGLEYAPNTSDAWLFNTDHGNQGHASKAGNLYAIAVRPGDVAAVPVPAAVWLMGSALFGLVGF